MFGRELIHRLPSIVGVEADYRRRRLAGEGLNIFLVDHAVLVHDERVNSGKPIFGWPCGKTKPANKPVFNHVIVCPPWCVGALSVENPEIVSVVRFGANPPCATPFSLGEALGNQGLGSALPIQTVAVAGRAPSSVVRTLACRPCRDPLRRTSTAPLRSPDRPQWRRVRRRRCAALAFRPEFQTHQSAICRFCGQWELETASLHRRSRGLRVFDSRWKSRAGTSRVRGGRIRPVQRCLELSRPKLEFPLSADPKIAESRAMSWSPAASMIDCAAASAESNNSCASEHAGYPNANAA
jgi:hypothetical protein